MQPARRRAAAGRHKGTSAQPEDAAPHEDDGDLDEVWLPRTKADSRLRPRRAANLITSNPGPGPIALVPC